MASYIHEAPHRPVVGVHGKLTPASLEAVGVSLLDALFAGDNLTAARTKAGAAGDVEVTTMLSPEQSDSWKLPKGKTDFWDAPPKSANLKMFVQNAPTCVTLNAGSSCDVAGFKAGDSVPAEQITAAHVLFDCDAVFDGPWFTCEATNSTTGTDFKIKGVLSGVGEGNSLLIHVNGAPSKKMTQVTVVGAGTITKASNAGTTLTLQFNGPAAASTYVDGEGRCCVAKSPLLQGNQSQFSVLTIER